MPSPVFRGIILAIFLLSGFALPCQAQQETLSEFRETFNDLRAITHRIQADRERLPNEANVSNPVVIGAATSPTLELPADDSFTSDSRLTQNYGKNMDAIRERIDLLRKMRQSNATSVAKEPASGSPTLSANELRGQNAGAEAIGQFVDASSDTNASPQPPSMTGIQNNLDANRETRATTQQQDLNNDAERILSSPADSMELAQSLFQTKNYSAVLQTIATIERETISDEDAIWLDLLTGLCQRRLGDTVESDKLLRVIANSKTNNFAVPVAQNWLMQSQVREETKASFGEVSANIDQIMESVKRHER